ncbi:MAG: PAS domain-containing protein [Cyanobacteria bacterium SZAS LIN-3]|nr:PAS domain-containing protein [Cyanobacteria bacterium SZAS LIN-3]
MLSLSSLRTKIFILISVPLVLQLALIAAVAYLQNQAEEEARKAEVARRISDEVLELTRDILSVKSNFGTPDSVHLNPVMGSKYQTLTESIEAHFNQLRRLTRENPEQLRSLNRAINNMYEGERELTIARSEYRQAKRSGSANLTPAWAKLNASTMALSRELLSLGDAGKALAQASPERQRKFREDVQTLLIAGGCANIALSLLLGLLLARSIVNRLNVINDNSYRLASNRPLNEPLSGGDEIARVDKIFHQMASDMKNAASKERAILESAYDCICSFDTDLKFVSANPACESLFAISDENILSTPLTDYLDAGDTEKACAFRDQAMLGKSPKPLKITIRRTDGEPRQALWSARWAPMEGSKGELYSIFHDVTEQSHAEQLRQDVVAMVTHDLRTPLMTVEICLDMLETLFSKNPALTANPQDKSLKHLAGAKRSCNRMMLLIGDLIDIEKIKSGMMAINLQPVSAAEIFEQVMEESAALATETGVLLKIKPTKSVVMADRQMLHRVLINLVSNAIKFTPKGGSITLSAHNSGTTVTFSVRDEGSGIPPEMLKKVFDRFQQAANQTSRSRGGSGLGLTICQAIVHLHRGQIWVESTEGEGSQFFFTLPKGQD